MGRLQPGQTLGHVISIQVPQIIIWIKYPLFDDPLPLGETKIQCKQDKYWMQYDNHPAKNADYG